MNNLATLNNNFDMQKNLYFTIGESKYAILLKDVLEVMKLPHLDYPQKLPNNIVGVLKFNNMVINVLDVRFYLNVEVKPYSTSNKLVVVKTDESMFGIIVDKIEDIIDFNAAQVERLPFVADNKIIDALYRVENETVSILNMFALEQLLRHGVEDKGVNIPSLFPSDEASVELFKERSINLQEKLESNVLKSIYSNDQFVSFALNNTKYCMNLIYVKEVTNKVNVIPIPCAPSYVEGLMTIRGDFVTILNFKKFLNLNVTTYSEKPKVIIIDSNEYKLGFLVDDIFEIMFIPEEQIDNKCSNIEDAFIFAEVINGKNIQLVLNMDKILSDEKLYIE